MKLLALMGALSLAVCLAPSGLSQEKGEDKDTSYYPLKVGNQWTYKAANGQKTITKATKEEKVGEVMCVKLETTVNSALAASEHLAAKADGIYRYAGNGMEIEPPVLVLKLPPKKGDSWKIDSKFAGLTIQGTFTVGEEPVAVAGVKYKAVTVSTDDMKIGDDSLTTKLWFAPGVGMVKQVMNLMGKKVELELEKFEGAK
jgi:hypothetical protein